MWENEVERIRVEVAS